MDKIKTHFKGKKKKLISLEIENQTPFYWEGPRYEMDENIESHFKARIVSNEFEGKSQAEREKMIKDVIKDELKEEVKVFKMETWTKKQNDAHGKPMKMEVQEYYGMKQENPEPDQVPDWEKGEVDEEGNFLKPGDEDYIGTADDYDAGVGLFDEKPPDLAGLIKAEKERKIDWLGELKEMKKEEEAKKKWVDAVDDKREFAEWWEAEKKKEASKVAKTGKE